MDRTFIVVSIRTPREGRDVIPHRRTISTISEVSIRTPREGRDCRPVRLKWGARGFNPHAPRGARPRLWLMPAMPWSFQSARPARGATRRKQAPHRMQKFQSARPARGATIGRSVPAKSIPGFNPHAPRGARPAPCSFGSWRQHCFNPHAPRGARRNLVCAAPVDQVFQSARPARGATRGAAAGFSEVTVSIRTPREGRDAHHLHMPKPYKGFNPHAPRGARR